jgi:Phytanoyl-CoA dioxygenase (PhyH)
MKQLSKQQIDNFINDGFLRIEHAFPTAIADECRAILWKATQCDPHDPATWTQPVIRIGELGLKPFKKAANTPLLHTAFDQLAGKDNWIPRATLGSFPIRFPSKEPAGDTGWHVDASFPGEDPGNYLQWRINFESKGRALLMLFLFSDVSEDDAPTLIRVGSHLDVARVLEPAGVNGLSFMELAQKLGAMPSRSEALATGKAGTVYLCHPFIVHAAQHHHGNNPKFMAQPPLQPKANFNINRPENELCPVEKAIVKGLHQDE